MGSQTSPEETARKFGGAVDWYKLEHPAHPVKISKPFYLQTTEVTQGQWKSVMGGNPSHFSECGDDCPVEAVSWDEIQAFLEKLNKLEGHYGADRYRLPTEAEWEYACRAGTSTAFSFGDDAGQLSGYAWFGENSDQKTHPVGTKKPNSWGLFDMHGNVLEWVEDDWHDNYNDAPDDGRAWIGDPRAADRVMRGGGWGSVARNCRSAERLNHEPDYLYSGIGFRLARSAKTGS
jgi:formylglycine-generating enzyme required for sulfatase activity